MTPSDTAPIRSRRRKYFDRVDPKHLPHFPDAHAAVALNALLNLENWTAHGMTVEADGSMTIVATFDHFPDAREVPAEMRRGCPRCGAKTSLEKHSVRPVDYRDIPIHGRNVCIRVYRQTFRCSNRGCGQTTPQPLPGVSDRFGLTSRFRRHIERQARLPVSWLAEQCGLSERRVSRVLDRYFQRRMFAHRDEPLRIIAIDDVALRNGVHTIFVDGQTGRLVTMVRGKNSVAVSQVLRQIAVPGILQAITMDGEPAYKKAAEKARLHVPVVLDKWHLLKKADEAFWEFFSHARSETGPAERKGYESIRKILLSRPNRRSPEDISFLRDWWIRHPLVLNCHLTRAAFYSLWRSIDRSTAAVSLRGWIALIPDQEMPFFKKLVDHLLDRIDSVLNYFPSEDGDRSRRSLSSYRITNAKAENLNGIIRKIDRRGRGYSEPRLLARAMFKQADNDFDWLQCWNCRCWFHTSRTDFIINTWPYDAAYDITGISTTYAFHRACHENPDDQASASAAMGAGVLRSNMSGMRQLSLALSAKSNVTRSARELTWYGDLGAPELDEEEYQIAPETLARLGYTPGSSADR